MGERIFNDFYSEMMIKTKECIDRLKSIDPVHYSDQIINNESKLAIYNKYCIPNLDPIKINTEKPYRDFEGVYLLTALFGGIRRLYKIGMAKDLQSRFFSVNLDYYEPVQIVHFIPTLSSDKGVLELRFHTQYKEKNVVVKRYNCTSDFSGLKNCGDFKGYS